MSQPQPIHHVIAREFSASPDARHFEKRSPVDGQAIARVAEGLARARDADRKTTAASIAS